MLDRAFFRKMGRATAVVTEMAVTVILGVYIGSYLDTRLGFSPVFLLSFTLRRRALEDIFTVNVVF